ncbi:malonyl-ACP O-methyltransferase BioC [Steroidobacter sp.]|uniref:malonyl-ACP O-methyltransferase BioC n=1 Tax=Steroidobacter sp. TaxID=1978227 RepID=UPI001A3E8FED|nr:malonyl-ACP O-methyltransferase BioC [Steroidobacter sp.]MBL8268848.1 malonyl-ACP O-methyltransferase BioC [Steroidobacter sp.]
MPDEFYLAPANVRRSFDKAAKTYDDAAIVQAEIRTRLLERLDLVKLQPKVVLDLGAGTGHASKALKQRYKTADVVAVDLAAGMLVEADRRQSWFKRFHRIAADAHRLPFKDASAQLVFSNLMLEWCHDPDAVFQEIRRVLQPGGLLTFATLGPDTLRELREGWRKIDSYQHVHRFIDMHDLGDALVRAGLAEPVMDTERLTVTYPHLDALLAELAASGSTNLAHGRARGLTSKARLESLRQSVRPGSEQAALSISVEVVYGHAWATELRPRRQAGGEVRIPVTSLTRTKR